ncbi:MAG: hypothetical protein ACK4Y6_05345 [Bacteroidota bacterium]
MGEVCTQFQVAGSQWMCEGEERRKKKEGRRKKEEVTCYVRKTTIQDNDIF